MARKLIRNVGQKVLSISFFYLFATSCFIVPSLLKAQETINPTRVSQIKVIKQNNGAWQMLIDGKPFFIKGVVFSPVKIGEAPEKATARFWMNYDDQHDGRNDIAYKTWLDKNHNNHRDADEPVVGDFQLLKDLGVNTIREYQIPSNNPILGDNYKINPSVALQFDHPVKKALFRDLYTNYGIRVIVGNFLGSWTIGSGSTWQEGTDYTNPKHLENMMNSVKAMVLDNKDEPYVLMWELGNENNIADWSQCNAKQHPQEYTKFVGKLARMIHHLDPNHPVAVSMGDGGSITNQEWLKLYAENAPEVDIIDFNSYRGPNGFFSLWKEVKKNFDRPVLIAEFGTGAYDKSRGEDQAWQDQYIRGCWKDIVLNSSDYFNPNDPEKASGNSIGGVIYDWVDRWYRDGPPTAHVGGTKEGGSRDFVDNEEWFGIMSMGDGSDTLMRQERKICAYLKETWTKDKLTF